jgi:hypothetical protein
MTKEEKNNFTRCTTFTCDLIKGFNDVYMHKVALIIVKSLLLFMLFTKYYYVTTEG